MFVLYFLWNQSSQTKTHAYSLRYLYLFNLKNPTLKRWIYSKSHLSYLSVFITLRKVRHILTSSVTMLPGAYRFAGWQSFSTLSLPFRISLLIHRKERKSYFICPFIPVETVCIKQNIRLFFTVIIIFSIWTMPIHNRNDFYHQTLFSYL